MSLLIVKENIDLKEYTTFHIGGPAKFFCSAISLEQIEEALKFAKERDLPIFILGGGSNSLISDSGFPGLVINIDMKGFEVVDESGDGVVIKVGAGEVWDDVVARAIEKNWWGIENMSHVPGSMGAFAIQNVGCYGQEAKDVVLEVESYDTQTNSTAVLSNSDCGFTYRQSIFNTTQKTRYIILSITLKLSKIPARNLSYQDVSKYFEVTGNTEPSISEIRKAITEIRDKKFPYPHTAVNGSAGSFFKGTIIDAEEFDDLLEQVSHHFGDKWAARFEEIGEKFKTGAGIKIPAAILIEMCGFKGKENGGAKLNPPQPAILLNASGTATAADVLGLFKLTRQTVYRTTGIQLVQEPELIGFTESELENYFSLT